MNTTGVVYTKIYEEPPINKKEILRYAGVKGELPEINELLEQCLAEIKGRLVYKVCYCDLDIHRSADALDLGFIVTSSADLRKNLKNCESIILFGATVGIELDRLIARYNTLSPSKALMFQAIGAERIESLCDTFNDEIIQQCKEQGRSTAPRFSPGYGDLPLDVQKDIFRVLDCPRKIGLTLNDSLLMSPSKSVTAIIGVSACGISQCEATQVGSQNTDSKCEKCGNINCEYRKA